MACPVLGRAIQLFGAMAPHRLGRATAPSTAMGLARSIPDTARFIMMARPLFDLQTLRFSAMDDPAFILEIQCFAISREPIACSVLVW